MKVKTLYDQRTFTLTHVVWDEATKDAVIIDPVLDYEPIGSFTWAESVDEVTEFVKREGLKPRWLLETHAHADHLSGSQVLKKRFGAGVVIGENIRVVQETFKPIFDLPELPTDGSQFDRLVKDGETLEAGSLRVQVIGTPGHTPACVSYLVGDAVFTGDALFMDDYGTGRCDFPRGSAETLYDSVQKLYRLPDETRVFPGHDYPEGREVRFETTIGASKRNNPQLRADTPKEEFVRFRKERDAKLKAPKLLFQSVQVNVDAGRLPPARASGLRCFNLPLNLGKKVDEDGVPAGTK